MLKSFSLIALLIAFFSTSLTFFVEDQLRERYRNEQRVAVAQELATLRAKIEKDVVENLSLIYGAANFISVTPDLTQEAFAQYAKGVLDKEHQLKNLGAARGFVMSYVYPLEGNRKVLGIDYRDIPEQWKQVQLAKETGKMVVAGPLKLIQGGVGLIGRAPVFVRNGESKEYWGIVSAVINADLMFEKMEQAEKDGLQVAIRGVDGAGDKGGVFWGDAALFSPASDTVTMSVTLPSGYWVLAATPAEGWADDNPVLLYFRILLGTFTLLILVLVYRMMKKNHEVKRTRESLAEAQSIARLGSWEYWPDKARVWWSDETYRIFGVNKKTFTPSLDTFFTAVHPDDRKGIADALETSNMNRTQLLTEHRIIRPDGTIRYVQERGMPIYDAKGNLIKNAGTVQDITDRALSREKLQNEQAKFKAMTEASYDAFIMVNSQGIIMFWSPAAQDMFGWTEEEAIGKEIHDLIAPAMYREKARKGLAQFATTGKGEVMESVLEFDAIRKDGSIVPVERSVSAFMRDGEYFAVGILRDITERRKYQEELKQLARTDKMTGLFNRGHFVEMAKREIERSRRYGSPLSLIMFDADKFKDVNDTYGHSVGDMVLVSTSKTVAGMVREADVLGRIGGEEFAILLPETDLDAAEEVAEKIRLAVEEAFVELEDGRQVQFTVSLGVAVFSKDIDDIEDLLKKADTALYLAKANGRNRYEVA